MERGVGEHSRRRAQHELRAQRRGHIWGMRRTTASVVWPKCQVNAAGKTGSYEAGKLSWGQSREGL